MGSSAYIGVGVGADGTGNDSAGADTHLAGRRCQLYGCVVPDRGARAGARQIFSQEIWSSHDGAARLQPSIRSAWRWDGPQPLRWVDIRRR